MNLTIPTILTLLRIVLLPVIVVLFYVPAEWSGPVCAGVFALAGFTDWLDGYLARKLNQTSSFGAFLDPVADKLMVAVVLVLLVSKHPTLMVSVCACIVICREILISALREWMAEIGQRDVVSVNWLGKWKTTFQMLALGFMLFEHDFIGLPIYFIGEIFLVIASILTLYSMVSYLQVALKNNS